MNDTLGLPKPGKQPKIDRERREGANDEGRMLESVGIRLTPEGLFYAGSLAVHVYYHKLSNECVIMSQPHLGTMNEEAANRAIKELARATMLKYGKRPPKKIGEGNDI